MTTNPMEPVQKLLAAFSKQIEDLGMEVHTFALLPNPAGPPHMVQVMLAFDGKDLDGLTGDDEKDGAAKDKVDLSDEEKAMFDMLARDTERSAEEEKAGEAAAALMRLKESLEGGGDKGIFGDD
jgi:hypothetical protein